MTIRESNILESVACFALYGMFVAVHLTCPQGAWASDDCNGAEFKEDNSLSFDLEEQPANASVTFGATGLSCQFTYSLRDSSGAVSENSLSLQNDTSKNTQRMGASWPELSSPHHKFFSALTFDGINFTLSKDTESTVCSLEVAQKVVAYAQSNIRVIEPCGLMYHALIEFKDELAKLRSHTVSTLQCLKKQSPHDDTLGAKLDTLSSNVSTCRLNLPNIRLKDTDFDGDARVDAKDVEVMFGQFGQPGSADVSGDGLVDAKDAGELFADFTG